MITSEQALDMLPIVVDLYEKLDLESLRKDIESKYAGQKVDQKAVGIEAFKYVFKNSGKAKDEILGIVAIVERKSVEEIKKQSFLSTVMSLKAIFSDKEMFDFFKSAMQ